MVVTDEYDDMSTMVASEGIMMIMAIKEIKAMTNMRGEMVIMINRMNVVMMGVGVVEFDNEEVASSG